MKILVISDNHGYVDEGILHHAAWADEVWHAGDWLNTAMHEAITKLGKPIVGGGGGNPKPPAGGGGGCGTGGGGAPKPPAAGGGGGGGGGGCCAC